MGERNINEEKLVEFNDIYFLLILKLMTTCFPITFSFGWICMYEPPYPSNNYLVHIICQALY